MNFNSYIRCKHAISNSSIVHIEKTIVFSFPSIIITNMNKAHRQTKNEKNNEVTVGSF